MKNNIPQHVAIIMDGNGRWARERGLPRYLGHKAGAESVREIIRVSSEVGIKYLTLYTFSLENWKRPEREVNFLMKMLATLISEEVDSLVKNNVRIDFIGRLELLPASVKDEIRKAREKTSVCNGLNVFLALSYGGRAEILDAVRKFLESGSSIEALDEESFKKFTYFPDVPDPDLLIRTGGEIRISNFLLWHIAYTEFYFTSTLWPDFRKEEYLKILEDFSKRHRRFGGVIEG
ncbi:MAG: isoprenyl transferase [Candidatus Hydrothermia bacterium]